MEQCKILKISTGENILCKVDVDNIFDDFLLTISEPIVINIVRMPTSKGTVETCVMYPWSVFSIDNIFKVSTSQIVAVTDPSLSVQKYYASYLESLNQKNEDHESSMFEEEHEHEFDDILDQLTNEDEDGTDSTGSGKRTYH